MTRTNRNISRGMAVPSDTTILLYLQGAAVMGWGPHESDGRDSVMNTPSFKSIAPLPTQDKHVGTSHTRMRGYSVANLPQIMFTHTYYSPHM